MIKVIRNYTVCLRVASSIEEYVSLYVRVKSTWVLKSCHVIPCVKVKFHSQVDYNCTCGLNRRGTYFMSCASVCTGKSSFTRGL